jgi:hypothetical protein
MNKAKSAPGTIRLVMMSCLLVGFAAKVGAQNARNGWHEEEVPVGDVGVVDLPALGGTGGGQFQDACAAGRLLGGFELRAGDDVDAIRPICIAKKCLSLISRPEL